MMLGRRIWISCLGLFEGTEYESLWSYPKSRSWRGPVPQKHKAGILGADLL